MTVRSNEPKRRQVKKKATRAASTVQANRVTLTTKQLQMVASFYEKQGKKVPAFITRNLQA